jgi:hypothetical protein
MDEGSAKAVRTAFKRLWDAGLVYRGEALVNWCPRCLTTISDLENVHRDEMGTLWTIRYHLERRDGTPDPDAWISVATTRPRRSLATRPWPSIRMTSGIERWSGVTPSCPSSDVACRSSRMMPLTGPSAPAP